MYIVCEAITRAEANKVEMDYYPTIEWAHVSPPAYHTYDELPFVYEADATGPGKVIDIRHGKGGRPVMRLF